MSLSPSPPIGRHTSPPLPTPTLEFNPHPPHLLTSLLPSIPNPSNLLAAVPGAAHATVLHSHSQSLGGGADESPAVSPLDTPAAGGGSGFTLLPQSSSTLLRGSTSSRRRRSFGGDTLSRSAGSLRRRGAVGGGRSVAMVAASLTGQTGVEGLPASELGEGEGGRGVDEGLLPESRKRVLDDIRELFAGRPTPQIWERSFRSDCTYEDPLARCTGLKQVAAQFHLLPLLFPPSPPNSSLTLSSTLLASTPTQLVISQTQLYTLRGTSLKKTLHSLVVVELDPADRVREVWDLWGGEDVPVRWGAGMLRRLNGIALPWIVRVPKEVSRVHEEREQ